MVDAVAERTLAGSVLLVAVRAYFEELPLLARAMSATSKVIFDDLLCSWLLHKYLEDVAKSLE